MIAKRRAKAALRGNGDFLDVGESLPFEQVVEPVAASQAMQRPGEHVQRHAPSRHRVQVPFLNDPQGLTVAP